MAAVRNGGQPGPMPARAMPARAMPASATPDVRGRLDAMLLATIAHGPVHGYGIIDRVRSQTGGAVSLEGGTLYPALRRLEENGLIAGFWTHASGRRRRVYTLTANGTAALRAERSAWRHFVRTLGSVLDDPKTMPGTAGGPLR